MRPAPARLAPSATPLGGAGEGRLSSVTTMATALSDPRVVGPADNVPSRAEPFVPRRTDRRRRPTPMLSRYVVWGGRRRTVRRVEEREGAFVDVHGARLFLVIAAIIALNVLDAWFTLLFLAHGGRELNPFVQVVLDLGSHPWPFLLFKTVGIGCACAFLALTKNFRPARIGMAIVFVGYALLLGWHLYLLSWLDSMA